MAPQSPGLLQIDSNDVEFVDSEIFIYDVNCEDAAPTTTSYVRSVKRFSRMQIVRMHLLQPLHMYKVKMFNAVEDRPYKNVDIPESYKKFRFVHMSSTVVIALDKMSFNRPDLAPHQFGADRNNLKEKDLAKYGNKTLKARATDYWGKRDSYIVFNLTEEEKRTYKKFILEVEELENEVAIQHPSGSNSEVNATETLGNLDLQVCGATPRVSSPLTEYGPADVNCEDAAPTATSYVRSEEVQQNADCEDASPTATSHVQSEDVQHIPSTPVPLPPGEDPIFSDTIQSIVSSTVEHDDGERCVRGLKVYQRSYPRRSMNPPCQESGLVEEPCPLQESAQFNSEQGVRDDEVGEGGLRRGNRIRIPKKIFTPEDQLKWPTKGPKSSEDTPTDGRTSARKRSLLDSILKKGPRVDNKGVLLQNNERPLKIIKEGSGIKRERRSDRQRQKLIVVNVGRISVIGTSLLACFGEHLT